MFVGDGKARGAGGAGGGLCRRVMLGTDRQTISNNYAVQYKLDMYPERRCLRFN